MFSFKGWIFHINNGFENKTTYAMSIKRDTIV